MRTILGYKTFAFAALILWLLAGWSGVHGHLCFDGQEPPLSVHMDMLGDHPEHQTEQQHQDADLDPGQLVLAKLMKVDLSYFIAAALLLVISRVKPEIAFSRYTRCYLDRPHSLRPPLRAPPIFPV